MGVLYGTPSTRSVTGVQSVTAAATPHGRAASRQTGIGPSRNGQHRTVGIPRVWELVYHDGVSRLCLPQPITKQGGTVGDVSRSTVHLSPIWSWW